MPTFGGGTWSFAGISFNQLGITTVMIVDGNLMPPAKKGSNPSPAGKSGEFYVPKLHQARQLTMSLWVTPQTGVGDGNLAMYAQLDTLANAFATDSQQSLVWTHPSGATRTATAEVLDVKTSRITPETAVLYQVMITFLLADPWFYGDAVIVSQSLT